jgi:hypothetical protein
MSNTSFYVSKHHKPIQNFMVVCGYNILWGNHTELKKYEGILVSRIIMICYFLLANIKKV